MQEDNKVTLQDVSNDQDKSFIKQDPVINILISKNNMEATLEFEMGEDCLQPTEKMIRDKLSEHGVTFGILDDAISRVVTNLENHVCVALGTPPQNGVDAVIINKFDIEKCGKPVEVEHGRVDFKNLNLFILVKKGELLAERIPATEGTAGIDILGRTVAAKPGKSAMLPAGKNTKIVDDNKIFADIEGQIVVNGNKISVDPTLQIRGDVDLSTGNIEFSGSVFIKGSVHAGFSVKAVGDIEINGNISGGTVEGRNVIVRAGIQGMQRGHIKADIDVRSSYVENAKVMAGRDILISEAILHSEVSAGKRVVVEGKRGVIAGGSIVAGAEIRVKTAGNQMDTNTKLEVGINPLLRQEYQVVKKALVKSRTELDKVKKGIAVLKSAPPESLSPQKHELLLRLTQSQFPMAGKVKKLQDRLLEIEDEFLELKAGKIRIMDSVYPGVKIVIGSLIRTVRTREQHCVFYVEDGEVRVGAY